MDKKVQSEQLLNSSSSTNQPQQIIFEKLDDDQKQEVDSWAKGRHRFSDNFFGGKDANKQPIQRRYFDFKHTDESPIKHEVHAHISKHGYQVSDYKSGLAKDKHGRDVRIGKVLNKTKADPTLLKKFNEDPARSSKSAQNLKILISRHPHDVAGMTSQGHSWEGKSCMNFECGQYNNKLKADVKHGTHVAYLVHADDTNGHPEKPIARIAIKKHSSENKKHHLLIPEDRVYGDAPAGFHHQVKDILDKEHNDHQPVGIYKKHDRVYHDSNKSKYHAHIGNNIDAAINHPLPEFRRAAAEHHAATPHHLEKALNDTESTVRAGAASNPNATDEQLSTAIRDKADNVVTKASKNPNLKSHHIDHILSIKPEQGKTDWFDTARMLAVNHPSATSENLTKAATDASHLVRRAVLHHPKSTKDHVEQLYKDSDYRIRADAVSHKDAQPHHIESGIKDPESHVRISAIQNPNISGHQLHNILADRSSDDGHVKVFTRRTAIAHKNIDSSHLDVALDDPDTEVRASAIHRYDHIQPHHLDKALHDSHPYVRIMAAQSHKAQPQHIEKALQDKDHSVRDVAFKSPHVQPHHIDKGMLDSSSDVRLSAVSNPNAQPHHIEKALKDFDPRVRSAAAGHKNAQAHHLHAALGDEYSFVRYAAITNPNINAEHIKKALSDPHSSIAGIAHRLHAERNQPHNKAANESIFPSDDSEKAMLFETEMLKSRGGYMPNAWWAARDAVKGKSHIEIGNLRRKVQDKLKDAKLKRYNTRRHEELIYNALYDAHGPEFHEKPEADYGWDHHEAERKADAADKRYHTFMAIDYGLKRAHDDAITKHTQKLAKKYGGFSESTDVGLKNQLKIAKATIKMSDMGADLAGGMSKRDAVNLIVKHHGPEKAKKLLKQAGHKDEEMLKLLEGTHSNKFAAGLWFGHEDVTKHAAFDQGVRVAALVNSHSKLNQLKKAALKSHIHHAKMVLDHHDKMNRLLASRDAMNPTYMHHDSEAMKHKEKSDKFHAFAKGLHHYQSGGVTKESCHCDDKNVYHLVNVKSGKVVKSAKAVFGKNAVKAPLSLSKLMDKLGSDHEILHDQEYSNNVNSGKHPDFRKK